MFPCDGVTPHPGAIWLFAGKEEGEIEKWIQVVREKSPETVIFVQVGSVEVLNPVLQSRFLPSPCLLSIEIPILIPLSLMGV